MKDSGRAVRDRQRKLDFNKLWAAVTISCVGSEITVLALPLVGVLTLDATPLEMGVLFAAGSFPYLLCSLPAGVLVDRLPRRPVMIGTDIASALLLLSLPTAMALRALTFAQLCLVAFGVGTLAVAGDAAHYAYVPTLVGRRDVTSANIRLEISLSTGTAAGQGLGGVLVEALTAPFAVLTDAASFLASAGLLSRIRHEEAPPQPPTEQSGIRESLKEGLWSLLSQPLLRSIVVAGAALVLFESASSAIFVLYATRDLGLDPAILGLIFAAAGVGAIPGALLAPWAGRRFGVGPSIIAGWVAAAALSALVPLAGGPTLLIVVMLVTSKALGSLMETVANVHQLSLRQIVAPDELSGRITAGHRFVVYGAGALGGLLGGVSGSELGLRTTLFVCVVGGLLSTLLAVFSPLRTLRESPTAVGEGLALDPAEV